MILNTWEYIRTSHEHLGGVESGKLVITWRKLVDWVTMDMWTIQCDESMKLSFYWLYTEDIESTEQNIQNWILNII